MLLLLLLLSLEGVCVCVDPFSRGEKTRSPPFLLLFPLLCCRWLEVELLREEEEDEEDDDDDNG